MTFDEYQELASTTAIYPERFSVTYPALGLCGEAGEVSEKVKKVIRDKDGIYRQAQMDEIAKELGDVLWYVSAICRDLGLRMDEVAMANLEKLQDRKSRHVLHGSGDAR